jgi:hypothetical protein
MDKLDSSCRRVYNDRFAYSIHLYGHNWARILFLILFIVGCIPFLLLLPQVITQSAIVGSVNIVQQVLQFGALFLVFTKPGALWFRKTG